MSNRKVLLMILDGWGIGDGQKGDVIAQVHPAYISEMTRKYPHAQLRTDGENVGLPDGQMGNSEVGHLNIGAGRVVYQDLVKINRACRDDSILKNPEIVKAFEYAKSNGVSVHLMGLVSDGGVHSSLDHLLKLTDIADKYGIERTYVHCFMDGRDTDPYSGKGFIERLEKHMRERSTGVVASIVGRYYAMDRDKRWERVKVAYDLLVEGKGEHSSDMALAMQKSYDEGVTDEFVKPVVRIDEDGNPIGMIRPNDVVIFFNYRNDRAKELTIVLTQEDMPAAGHAHAAALLLLHDPLRRQVRGAAYPVRQGERGRHDWRVCRPAGAFAAPYRRNGEIRSCDLLPERRPRGGVRGRGPHSGRFSEGGDLRPSARDERLRGGRQAGRGTRQAEIRFHLPEFRQRRYGGAYGSL